MTSLSPYEVSAIVCRDMRPAREVIQLIPNVKPRLAMKSLKDAAARGGSATCSLDNEELDLALSDGWQLLISPIGARLLRALFDEGKIPQNRPFGDDLSELDAYIATEAAFRASVAARISERERYLERIAEIAADPDCACPEELTEDLIDKVFLAVHGYGYYGTMRIAGLECHKSSTPARFSNTGKTRTPGTTYCWWIDANGVRQGQQKPEEFLNRRNDPRRNWGLGRE